MLPTKRARTSYRRRAERQVGLWYGRYRTGFLRPFVECRLFDVSILGAAMELEEPYQPGRRLRLEVRCMGSALDSVRLRAQVRHCRPLPTGLWRVGVEFVDASRTRRAYLLRMIQRYSI
jgi:hypothetical protein